MSGQTEEGRSLSNKKWYAKKVIRELELALENEQDEEVKKKVEKKIEAYKTKVEKINKYFAEKQTDRPINANKLNSKEELAPIKKALGIEDGNTTSKLDMIVTQTEKKRKAPTEEAKKPHKKKKDSTVFFSLYVLVFFVVFVDFANPGAKIFLGKVPGATPFCLL